MNFWNDKLLRDSLADYVNNYRNVKLGSKIRELETRIDLLAKQLEKPKRGRPRKVDNAKNEEG
jgi:hypothetical protein